MNEPINKNKTFEWKKAITISIISICFITIILFFVFIKSPKEIAKVSLENVLKIVLVFPNKDLDALYNLSDKKIITDSTNQDLTNLNEDVEAVITPYFTEKGLSAFIYHKFTFGSFCAGTYWETEVKSIRISSDKDAERTLLFTANILCKKSTREEIELIIKGKAQYEKTGRLNYLKLSDSTVFLLNGLNRAFQNDVGLLDE